MPPIHLRAVEGIWSNLTSKREMSAFWSYGKKLMATTVASLPRTGRDIRQGMEAGPAASAEVFRRRARPDPPNRAAAGGSPGGEADGRGAGSPTAGRTL